MGVNQLLACLAVVATSGLGATARQGSGLSHVLRTVESSIDGGQAAARGVIPEPDASQASFATGALEDGCDTPSGHRCFSVIPQVAHWSCALLLWLAALTHGGAGLIASGGEISAHYHCSVWRPSQGNTTRTAHRDCISRIVNG